PALPGGEIRCIDVGHGPLEEKAAAKEIADGRENLSMDVLVVRVVGEQAADFVARQYGTGLPWFRAFREPSRFPGPRQAYADDDSHKRGVLCPKIRLVRAPLAKTL